MTANHPWHVPVGIPRQPGRKKLWLTSDEHYGHKNILVYQERPFANLMEMNCSLIENHNSVVGEEDTVIHVGDFSFGDAKFFENTVRRLNGCHYFMDGSHDRAMREYFDNAQYADPKVTLLPKLFEFTYSGRSVVLCHYQMTAWKASHHGESVHFYGHSHARTKPDKARRCMDVGVDTETAVFFPIQIDRAIDLLVKK